MKNFFILLFLLSMFRIHAQHMNITFCTATDKVDPVKDAAGNDQRHKSAMILDYIKVKKFGGSTAPIIWQFSKEPSDWSFDDGTYLDQCDNNNNNSNCSGCGTCTPPKSKGYDFGTISTKFEESVRVRGKDGDLYFESTGIFNQVCYTTPNIDLKEYRRNSLSLDIGWEGTSQDGFAAKNLRIFYSFNFGEPQWDLKINTPGKILGKNNATLSKTIPIPNFDVDAVNDLDRVLKLYISPNPVGEIAYYHFESDEYMQLNFEIYTISGQKIYQDKIALSQGKSKIEINTSDWIGGTYLVKMRNQDGLSSIQSFIVR